MKIKMLMLPKFETGNLTGDEVGEAQEIFEAFFTDAASFEIKGGLAGSSLYVKDGLALYITGMGKVNTAASLTALLCDTRFDFTDALIVSVGCAGGSYETTVMGDVVIATACVDFDLGHHADIRDLDACGAVRETTWYRDKIYDSSAYAILDKTLCDRIYSVTKNVTLETTAKTTAYMQGDVRTLKRPPRVIKGTVISGDNYWKGEYGHKTAVFQAESYNCPDPYAACEMEDVAVCTVAARFGLLSRVAVIRAVVDMDIFMNGATADEVFTLGAGGISDTDGLESADIFPVAMKNNLRVITAVIDAMTAGEI